MKTLVRMINLRGRELALLALAISVTLIVSACGNAEPTTAEPDGNQSSKKLSGTIDIDGTVISDVGAVTIQKRHCRHFRE